MKLIVTDLDSTLLRSDKSISDHTVEIFKKCKEKGILLGFASSRAESAMTRFINAIDPDFLICSGGATVSIGGKIIHESLIQPQSVKTILKMSREENKGRQDEREVMAHGTASKVGMSVGAIVCVLLVWASEFLFNIPEVGLAGWFVYFSMGGSNNIVLYKNLKKRQDLIWGIVEIICAVSFAATLVIKSMVAV